VFEFLKGFELKKIKVEESDSHNDDDLCMSSSLRRQGTAEKH
jgi:hypothetical protein